jgi:hypothetical protein
VKPFLLLIGILLFLAGLFLVLVGGIALIFTIAGFFPVGIGIDLMIVGAIVGVVGWFL